MNILDRKQYQRGVGLIEVLITLVVIGVGFIAIMGLQGTLMSGSATTKARNEAVALAREKTEELRNAIELDQFDTELGVQGLTVDPDYKDGIKVTDGSGNGKLNGVNAQFTRSWGVVDVTSVENTVELVMQVTWEDAQGANNEVKLNTLIAYASPLTSTLSQQDDDHALPAPGVNTGYEGLHRDDVGRDVDESGTRTSQLSDDDGGFVTSIWRYSNGHVQVRIAHTEGDTCPPQDIVGKECVVFTAFGGTLLRLGGTLYLDKIKRVGPYEMLVKATSPAYCAHKPETTCGNMECVEIQCYASGDCSKNGGEGCPDNWSNLADSGVLPDLNGGWYGKIGHFFYKPGTSQGINPPPDFCMGEDELVARSYYSLRTSGGDDWREGINQSYSCHNTLVTSSSCDKGYKNLVPSGIVWNSFKDHEVIRDVTGVDNTVLAANTTYCDIVAIYGSINFYPNDPPGTNTGDAIVTTPTYTLTMDTTGGTPAADADHVEACITTPVVEGVHPDTGLPTYTADYACNYVGTPWTGSITVTGERTETTILVPAGVDGEGNVIPAVLDTPVSVSCTGALPLTGTITRNRDHVRVDGEDDIECNPNP